MTTTNDRFEVHCIHQGMTPGDTAPHEQIAMTDHGTIMGLQVIHIEDGKKTGSISYSSSAVTNLAEREAEKLIRGAYRTAIEPYRGEWHLNIYGPGDFDPIGIRTVEDPNEGMLTGREVLRHLCSGGKVDCDGFPITD